MTTTPYLAVGDYAAYGAPGSATSAQALQATKMIDSYLKRPEGLLFGTDANGNPAYMLNATPSCVLTLVGAIGPSAAAVTFTVTGPSQSLKPGDVLILDKSNNAACEGVNVISVSGQSVTTTGPQFAHESGATAMGGLLISEQKRMPPNRPITRVQRTPIVAAPSAAGRYGYGRRGDDDSNVSTFNMLAVTQQFGGPPAWETFVPQTSGIDSETGTFWIQSGMLLAYYTEVRLHYVSGWSYDTMPDDIKTACALLMQAQVSTPTPGGQLKSHQAGDTKLEWFGSSQMSDDVKALIDQYAARVNY